MNVRIAGKKGGFAVGAAKGAKKAYATGKASGKKGVAVGAKAVKIVKKGLAKKVIG